MTERTIGDKGRTHNASPVVQGESDNSLSSLIANMRARRHPVVPKSVKKRKPKKR